MEKKNFIFFHGWGLSPISYKRIIDELSKKGKVISPTINFLNYEGQLSFIGNEISERTVVIGHSAGAIIALEFAKKYPQKVEKVILLCPVGFTTNRSFSNWLKCWFLHILKLGQHPALFIPDLVIDFAKTSLVHPVKSIKSMRTILKTTNLDLFNSKVVVIFGKNDDIIPLPKEINNVKFEAVKGDHYWFLRNPKLLMEKI